MTLRIDPLQFTDIPAVLAVQARAYAGLDVLESAALFANRCRLSPATCLVARQGATVQGYLVSYPWRADEVPALGAPVDALPSDADTWFLHDCAVLPAAAGQGVAAALVEAATAEARRTGLRQAALVSLAPAVGYWLRHGFEARDAAGDMLAGYGAGARYMVRAVVAGATLA